MSTFTGPLRLEHQNANWRTWKLLEPLTWEAEAGTIEIPAGFETDGASVPRFLWPFFPLTGRYLRAAVLHDYLWTLLEAGAPHVLAPTRAAADRQFLHAMRAVDVARPGRWVLYLSVRAYGFFKSL